MASIYALKGQFQNLLRPAVRWLYRREVTANQVTLFALAISLLVAIAVFWAGARWPWLYFLLPLWMLLRMAFNAVDGMLAREFGQKTRLGAYLNELSDVLADAALYLSLLGVVGVQPVWLWLLAFTAALTEYAGVLGLMVNSTRRYEGPMGKSDRAFLVGIMGMGLGIGWFSGFAVNLIAAVMTALCGLTVWRRVRAGLDDGHTAPQA